MTFRSELDELNGFKVFGLNKQLIEKHNQHISISFRLKINRRTHISNEEFKKTFLLNKNLSARIIDRKFASEHVLNTKKKVTSSSTTKKTWPLAWNWLDKGVIGPVLNQQECGSCYAFVTVKIRK